MSIIFAYIDPTSGSLLAQIVLGGAAGVIVVIKLLAARIRPVAARWLLFWRKP
jgi:hypothetical protein